MCWPQRLQQVSLCCVRWGMGQSCDFFIVSVNDFLEILYALFKQHVRSFFLFVPYLSIYVLYLSNKIWDVTVWYWSLFGFDTKWSTKLCAPARVTWAHTRTALFILLDMFIVEGCCISLNAINYNLLEYLKVKLSVIYSRCFHDSQFNDFYLILLNARP